MPTSLPAASPRKVVAKTTPVGVWRSVSAHSPLSLFAEAFSRVFGAASHADDTWKMLTIFCLIGLVLSLLSGTNAVDLTPELVGP